MLFKKQTNIAMFAIALIFLLKISLNVGIATVRVCVYIYKVIVELFFVEIVSMQTYIT